MKVTALTLLFAFAVCTRCDAGTTGVLNGYVREANGKPAVGALVTVVSPRYIGKRYTDTHGFYVFLALLPDTYSVRVAKAGSSGAYTIGAGIASDQTTTLNFRFTSLRQCPRFTRITPAATRGDETFWSLDMRQMGRYPWNVAPLINLPLVPADPHYRCL